MIKYTISALLIYLIIGLFLFFFQRKIIFNTSGIPKKPEYYGLLDVKEVSVTTSDGLSLLSWYKKAKNNNPTLLYLHGNSFDIGERSYRIEGRLKSSLFGLRFPKQYRRTLPRAIYESLVRKGWANSERVSRAELIDCP